MTRQVRLRPLKFQEFCFALTSPTPMGHACSVSSKFSSPPSPWPSAHIIPLFHRAGAFALCCTQALPDLLLHSHDDEESDEVRRVNFLILGQRTNYKFYLGEYQKHAYFQPNLTHSIPHRQTSFIHLHTHALATRGEYRCNSLTPRPPAIELRASSAAAGQEMWRKMKEKGLPLFPPPLSLPFS